MILMKDITREGNPVLREKCVDVKIPLSSEDEKTLNDMIEYIINSQDDELAHDDDQKCRHYNGCRSRGGDARSRVRTTHHHLQPLGQVFT